MNPTIKLLAHRPVVFCDRPGVLQLLVKVMPPVVRATDRPPMNIAIAIDRSGSMSGPPLMNARAAAKMLVDQMGKKVAMKSGLELAREMLSGAAKVIAGSTKPFFERALENIFHSLNSKAAEGDTANAE